MDEMGNRAKVISLAQQGLSDVEIAERIGLRASTVKAYRLKGGVIRKPHKKGVNNNNKITEEWCIKFAVEWRKTVNDIRQYCGKEKLPPTALEVKDGSIRGICQKICGRARYYD